MPALALACAPGKTSSWTHCPDWSKISSVTCDDYHYYDFEEKNDCDFDDYHRDDCDDT